MQLGMKIIFWKILYTLYEIHSYLGDKQDGSWAILKVNFIESFFFFYMDSSINTKSFDYLALRYNLQTIKYTYFKQVSTVS